METRHAHPKTHKKQSVFKDYANQEKRPSRKLLNEIKTIISQSDVELQKHTYWYANVLKDLNSLKQAFDDVEKLTLDAELSRKAYLRSTELHENYKHLRGEAKVIRQSMADVRSGKLLRECQEAANKLGVELHQKHQEQLAILKQHNADEIYRKQNERRAAFEKPLADANAILQQLEAELEKLNACCGMLTSKQKNLQTRIAVQKNEIKSLQEQANKELQQTMQTTIQEPEIKPGMNKELDELQKRYDQARARARFCEEHKDDLLKEKQRTLDSINADVSEAIKKLNNAALRYHANLDTKVMHGVLRLYEQFNVYKTTFDHDVKQYNTHIKDKDAAASYQLQLANCKKGVDEVMKQLWCEQFREMSGENIYDWFKGLPPKLQKELMAKKPDTTALAQTASTAAAVSVAKPSVVGIFQQGQQKSGKSGEQKRKELLSMHEQPRLGGAKR